MCHHLDLFSWVLVHSERHGDSHLPKSGRHSLALWCRRPPRVPAVLGRLGRSHLVLAVSMTPSPPQHPPIFRAQGLMCRAPFLWAVVPCGNRFCCCPRPSAKQSPQVARARSTPYHRVASGLGNASGMLLAANQRIAIGTLGGVCMPWVESDEFPSGCACGNRPDSTCSLPVSAGTIGWEQRGKPI